MTVRRRRVWMVAEDGVPAPIGKLSTGQYVLFTSMCVVAAVFGIVIPSAAAKVLYFSAFVAFFYLFILLIYINNRVQLGTVSVVQKMGSLRFAQSWLGQLMRYGGVVVGAVTTTVFAFLAISSAQVRGTFSVRAVLFSAFALFFWGAVVGVLVHLVKPRGVILTEAGVAEAWTAIPWDLISGIDVVRKHMPETIVSSHTGKKLRVVGPRTNSDVNVIAIVLRHYLDHPEERWMLTDPEKALMRVEELHGKKWKSLLPESDDSV
ncbi:hypothetical protein [Mycetocola lacteus]|nr:hypothetical protein [Mycetocola lacteus]